MSYYHTSFTPPPGGYGSKLIEKEKKARERNKNIAHNNVSSYTSLDTKTNTSSAAPNDSKEFDPNTYVDWSQYGGRSRRRRLSKRRSNKKKSIRRKRR